MNLKQFQAGREKVEDLGIRLGDDTMIGRPGYLYGPMHNLWIEERNSHWPEDTTGNYFLLLGNRDCTSDDLEPLERRLWEYALKSGDIENETLNDLIRLYNTWNEMQGLDLGSADEHLHYDESLTEEQRKWLEAYVALWEVTQ
jgi:hypothetical protein